MSMINFDQIENKLTEYQSMYAKGMPFELCIIDDFLTLDGLKRLEVDNLMLLQKRNRQIYFLQLRKLKILI
mgnify:CR=1 FL=1